MLGRNEPRKALALALSRLVLSHDTILRHAQTVLRAPELVEIPARASALDLWMAVLQRAEAEASVQLLVASVLDENPAAEALRAALQNFSLQEASAARSADPPVTEPSDLQRGSARKRAAAPRAPIHATDVLRPALLVAGGLVLAWRLVYWQAGEPNASSVERPTAQKAAPLRALGVRGVEPTDDDLRAELLACWRNSEGGDPEPPPSSVGVTLAKGTPGQNDQTVFSGSSLSVAPRFERCARAAGTRLLLQMTPGFSIEARLVLPSPPAAVADPDSAGEP
jgi:hypothetical protein